MCGCALNLKPAAAPARSTSFAKPAAENGAPRKTHRLQLKNGRCPWEHWPPQAQAGRKESAGGAGSDGDVNALPQCLQTVASSWTVPRQRGHTGFLLPRTATKMPARSGEIASDSKNQLIPERPRHRRATTPTATDNMNSQNSKDSKSIISLTLSPA
jgi:hypothetical protein